MTQPAPPDWIARWQRIARRIRVPLGFLTAGFYLFNLWRQAPQPVAVAWSLALVLPGLWLRGYAAGYVKKNRELTVTGPYAHTRNPLYLGSMLIAAGFALALLSWPIALLLAGGFAVIYIPVIASEERFLRGALGKAKAKRRRWRFCLSDWAQREATESSGVPAGNRRRTREMSNAGSVPPRR